MAWNEDRARSRIRRFMDSVPEGQIVVEDFRSYVAEARVRKGMFAADTLVEAALIDIPRNRAEVVRLVCTGSRLG